MPPPAYCLQDNHAALYGGALHMEYRFDGMALGQTTVTDPSRIDSCRLSGNSAGLLQHTNATATNVSSSSPAEAAAAAAEAVAVVAAGRLVAADVPLLVANLSDPFLFRGQ